MSRVFYRIIKTDPPAEADFQSYVALGIPLVRDDPDSRRLAEGISGFATLAQARRAARGLPHLGEFIAKLVIPDDAPVVFERTGKKPGHHTLWSEPSRLAQWVESVVQV